MKRFEITNVQNGMKFGPIDREELGPLQPEWGANPKIVVTDLSNDLQWHLDQIQQARLNGYSAANVAARDVAVAMYEWLVEGRPEGIIAMHPKRMKVKNANLKPGQTPFAETAPKLPDLTKLIPKI